MRVKRNVVLAQAIPKRKHGVTFIEFNKMQLQPETAPEHTCPPQDPFQISFSSRLLHLLVGYLLIPLKYTSQSPVKNLGIRVLQSDTCI